MATLGAAAILGGTSLLSGITGGKGAKKAAKIQAAAYQKGIDEEHRQFDTVQANNQPYMAAGTDSLAAIRSLLGLGGADAQASSIAALKASPAFTSQFDTGLEALNQGAAATGGLRGGNNALADSTFGSNLLAQIIQGQIGNLGNLVTTGQNAASGTNSAAISTGQSVSNLLGQQGGAQATAAAAPYAAFQQIISGLGNAAGNYASGGSSSAWNGQGAFPASAYGW